MKEISALLRLQPAFSFKKDVSPHGTGQHHDQRQRVTPGGCQFWHDGEIHAVDAGDQGWGQEHHRCHREYLDDVVLFQVNEAHGGLHQEVDLVEQEGRVGRQGINVPKDVPDLVFLAFVQAFVAGSEDVSKAALAVQKVQSHLAVNIFLKSDVSKLFINIGFTFR